MANIAYRQCPKCGAEVAADNVSMENHSDPQTVFIRYDPAYTKIILINSQSGVQQTITPSTKEQPPKARHIGGIIGPY